MGENIIIIMTTNTRQIYAGKCWLAAINWFLLLRGNVNWMRCMFCAAVLKILLCRIVSNHRQQPLCQPQLLRQSCINKKQTHTKIQHIFLSMCLYTINDFKETARNANAQPTLMKVQLLLNLVNFVLYSCHCKSFCASWVLFVYCGAGWDIYAVSLRWFVCTRLKYVNHRLCLTWSLLWF